MRVGDAQNREPASPEPHELYEQTGGGDAYRVAMLEHDHIRPVAPWALKPPGKRISACGLTHEPDWSEWRTYEEGGRRYEGRWCRVCATANVRADSQEDKT